MSSRRAPRRRPSAKRRAVTESQSTLTQIDFVNTTQSSFNDCLDENNGDLCPRSVGKKRRREVECGDDIDDSPRQRRKSLKSVMKFEVLDSEDESDELLSKTSQRSQKRSQQVDTNRKRQETLTQMAFGTQLGLATDHLEAEIGLRGQALVRVSDELDTHVEIQRRSVDPQSEGAQKTDRDISSKTGNPRVAHLLRTPKKFRDKEEIPSSQSPADSLLSTQRTPQPQRSPLAKRSFARNKTNGSPSPMRIVSSPLRERSPNVRALSISPTKFHIQQFTKNYRQIGRENVSGKRIGSCGERNP